MGEAEGKVNGHGQTEHSEAIVSAPPLAVGAYGEATVDQMLAKAQKQVDFRKGILKLIAANLEPGDVTLYGDGDKQTIHLTKHACKQILGWAGITVQPDSHIQEKHYDGKEGPYIDFEVWASWNTPDGRCYRAMGNRSTYDDFFAKRSLFVCQSCRGELRWDGKKAFCISENKQTRWDKTEYYLPLSEVDIPSIKQAAITNLWNHIVEDAGLRPSKKELVEVGFPFSEVKDRVSFKDNKKAPQQTSQNSSQAPPEKEASPKGAAASTPETPQTAAASSPKSNIPKANIPKGDSKTSAPARNDSLPVGKGIISEIIPKTTKPNKTTGKGGGTPYLEVIQNGHSLYCFANHETQTMEGPEKVFDLIRQAKHQFCDFVIETKDGERPMHSIVGASRIGRHEWENGEPVRRSEYQAEDEDIPF